MSSSNSTNLPSSSSQPASNTTTPFRFPSNYAYDEFLGVDIIPVYDRRLEAISTTGIKLPSYKNPSLYILIKHVGYRDFAYNLQNKNRATVLDRPTTEACWMRLVTSLYHLWDPREKASTSEDEYIRTFPFRLKMSILEEAKTQMDSENAKWYWEKKASDYPGLNIKTVMTTMTPEERLEYDMWMLGRPELPNSELNEEDLEILALGTDGAGPQDRVEGMEIEQGGNGGGNEVQSGENVGNVEEENAMDLD